MKKIFACLIGVILIGIILVFATYTPQTIKNSTVKDIIENAVSLDKKDIHVKLTGTVSSQISKKKYWFEDQTGEIVIEVKNDLIPLMPSNNQIEIEIQGDVDCQTNAGEGVKINVNKINFDEPEEDLQLL